MSGVPEQPYRPPQDLRRWAADYREARRPSPRLAQRIRRVQVASRSRRTQRSAIGFGVGAVVGLAAALILVFSVRTADTVGTSSGSPTGAQAAQAVADSHGALQTHKGVHSPAPIASVETPAKRVSAPADQAPQRALVRRRPTVPAQPEQTQVDLQSMRALRDAERLLRSNPGRALRLLELHARTYPDSAAGLEREALWLRAACLSGAEGIASRRKAFAQHPEHQAYAASVRHACDLIK